MTYETNDIPAEQHAHELADQEESKLDARYKELTGRDTPLSNRGSVTTQVWPKNGMWKCPKCVRHFMGGSATRRYEGRCNMCNTKIDREKDRVK